MSEDLDPHIQSLFAEQHERLHGEEFVARFMHKADRLTRWLILRRLSFAALVALTAIPLQDFAIEFAGLLMVQVVSIEPGLVAGLLAPVNSVGLLLSLGLFALRAMHRRIFVRD